MLSHESILKLKKFEIKNIGVFFIGIILLIIGSFIVVFDYPQIQYFKILESDSFYLLEENEKEIYERLKIEFSIGIVMLISGIGLSFFSLLKKSSK